MKRKAPPPYLPPAPVRPPPPVVGIDLICRDTGRLLESFDGFDDLHAQLAARTPARGISQVCDSNGRTRATLIVYSDGSWRMDGGPPPRRPLS